MPRPAERLLIENFAGIARLDLTVLPFTVIIGPQSVGKSITAKLLYFFQSLPRFLLDVSLDELPPPPEEALLKRFTDFFPEPTHAGQPCALTYKLGTVIIRLEYAARGTGRWKISLPRAVHKAFEAYRLRSEETRQDDEPAEFSSEDEPEDAAYEAYWSALSEVFPSNMHYCRFIPAGRSFYSQVESDAASFFATATLDPFVSDFGKLLARLKRRTYPPVEERPQSRRARGLAEQLLSGRFVREGKADFIDVSDGRRLPAKLWSSGQQEAQPLTFLLQHYCARPTLANPIFIEEPEAHLFPASQRTMTELIALAFNSHQPSLRMFLTTHSPYILTTINNLLLAGQIYQAEPPRRQRQSLDQLVPEDCALIPGRVGAFFMDRTGCRSVIDEDTGLIGSSEIDEVSGALNHQFEALLDFQSST